MRPATQTRYPRLVAGGLLLAALALAAPAQATLTLTVTDPNSGGTVGACSATDGGTGTIIKTCSDPDFNLTLAANSVLGFPTLQPAPGLSVNLTTLNTLVTGGTFPDTLTFTIAQTGLSYPAGTLGAILAVNGLIDLTGGINTPGPVTLTAKAGANQVQDVFPPNVGALPSSPLAAVANAETDAIFDVKFTAPSQAVLASIVITAPPGVPEPGSLALLGTALAGLAGLGVVARRRHRSA